VVGLAQRYETDNALEGHVRLIRGQITKSLDDAATRMLAAAIVAGNFDNVIDPRTGQGVPGIMFHGRWYRGAADWAAARQLCAQRDYACELTAIWNFGVLNVRYTQDQDGEDTYQTVRATLEAGAGDCDDLTILFAALAKAVGFENIVARIVSVHGATWDHIYPLVKLPRGGWIPMDATEQGKPLGWEYTRIAAKRDFAL
jgi:hypothetical protein